METSFSAWTTDRFSVIKMRRKVGVIIITQKQNGWSQLGKHFFQGHASLCESQYWKLSFCLGPKTAPSLFSANISFIVNLIALSVNSCHYFGCQQNKTFIHEVFSLKIFDIFYPSACFTASASQKDWLFADKPNSRKNSWPQAQMMGCKPSFFLYFREFS